MTSTTEPGSSADSNVIKTDSLGRLRTSAERREMLLDEFERSGLSGAEFAKMIGINYTTFAGWRQRRARGRTSGGVAKVRTGASLHLVEAVAAVKPDTTHAEDKLIVHLSGGGRMELSDVRQAPLACALLKSLQHTTASC